MGASRVTTTANRGPATPRNPNSVAARRTEERTAEEERIRTRAADETRAKAEAAETERKRREAEDAKLQEQRNPLYGLTPEQAADYARQEAIDQRYGSEYSWLDPTFQMSPELIGKSARGESGSDPLSQLAQYGSLNQAGGMANANLKFQDPAAQQALSDQWAAITGGKGAPAFMGNQTQEQLMQRLLGVQAPQFAGGGTQADLLNQARNFTSKTGPGALDFDTSGRQGEQYENLKGIIAGGGADAIEMARRQAGRADSEAWLRGQREADMADYGERGLAGSGMEMMNLAADRQSAAGRNSLSDLQTAAALEERRLGAINSAGGLATNMRGQTIDEQALRNQRETTGLDAATSLANAMRNADYNEQSFLNTSARDQAMQAGQIAGQMRGQDYTERTYNDQRMRDALLQNTDLQTKMRDQQSSESIANRSAQQQSLDLAARIADQIRQSSAQESQYRAAGIDDTNKYNVDTINATKDSNVSYLREQQAAMMKAKQDRWAELLRTGTATAQDLMDFDARENAVGATQATQIGKDVSDTYNKTVEDLRNTRHDVYTGGSGQILQTQYNQNALWPGTMEYTGKSLEEIINAMSGGGGGGMGGMGGIASMFGGKGGGAAGAGGTAGFGGRV